MIHHPTYLVKINELDAAIRSHEGKSITVSPSSFANYELFSDLMKSTFEFHKLVIAYRDLLGVAQELAEALKLAENVLEKTAYLGSYDATVKDGGLQANTDEAIRSAVLSYDDIEQALSAASARGLGGV